jgi:hypothetical protein
MTAVSTARHSENAGGLTSVLSSGNVTANFLFNSIDTYAQNLISLFQYRGYMALGLYTNYLCI